MPKSQSKDTPQQITITKLDDTTARVHLISDVITKPDANLPSEDGAIETMYEYNEVVYTLPYRDNLEQDIADNFNLFYNYGLQIENDAKRKVITDELDRLDKIVSRVEEDLIQQLDVTLHQSKLDIINRKKQLRLELAAL